MPEYVQISWINLFFRNKSSSNGMTFPIHKNFGNENMILKHLTFLLF